MTDQPTNQQLDEIAARAKAATPGPWGTYQYGGDSLIEIAADLEDTGCGYQARRTVCRFDEEPLDNDPAHREWTAEEDWEQVQADAAYIAAMSPDVAAALVAEVRRLRALLPTPTAVPTKDTPLSEYDFVELVAFASKVESEGFGYAYEEYPPHFEAPELAPIADDYSLLRQLFDEWEEALDEFWTRPDAEAVYDAHIDEARRRRREARAAAETGR